MNAFTWACVITASWTLLATVVAVPIGRAIKRADDAEQPQYPPAVPEPVRRMTVLPPVPPTAGEWDRFLRLINEDAA